MSYLLSSLAGDRARNLSVLILARFKRRAEEFYFALLSFPFACFCVFGSFSFTLSLDRSDHQIYVCACQTDTGLSRSLSPPLIMTTTYAPDVPSLTVENPMNGQTSLIKPDPDSIGASPSAHTDDDLYEDAGDLEFAGSDQGLYLTRLPKFLWERWSLLDDNQEVTIGTVRVEGGPESIKRVRHSSSTLGMLKIFVTKFDVFR